MRPGFERIRALLILKFRQADDFFVVLDFFLVSQADNDCFVFYENIFCSAVSPPAGGFNHGEFLTGPDCLAGFDKKTDNAGYWRFRFIIVIKNTRQPIFSLAGKHF